MCRHQISPAAWIQNEKTAVGAGRGRGEQIVGCSTTHHNDRRYLWVQEISGLCLKMTYINAIIKTTKTAGNKTIAQQQQTTPSAASTIEVVRKKEEALNMSESGGHIRKSCQYLHSRSLSLGVIIFYLTMLGNDRGTRSGYALVFVA